MTRKFKNLFVFGRPASGKSEFIDFLKKTEPGKLLKQFHIAPFHIIDDFQFLCDMAENEDILDKLQYPSQRMTERTEDGIVVTKDAFFDYVSAKMNIIVDRICSKMDSYYDHNTLLLEFSRGDGNVGYKHCLSLLKKEILEKGAIIYIKASYEEALRRNEARYKEKLKHSILAHKVPLQAMERFYQRDDWAEITKGENAGFVSISGTKLPFVSMENEPESTDPEVMEKRYFDALDTLQGIVSQSEV